MSLIIPAYNRSDLLLKTLASVFSQDHRPLQVIVIDDGSAEDIAAAVESLLVPPGVSLEVHRQDNSGPSAARNNGVSKARGVWLQFLDSDDILFANKISKQVAAAARHPEAEVLYGDWLQGVAIESARCLRAEQQEDMVLALLSGTWHPSFSYLFKPACVSRAGGWNERALYNDDFDFALRVAISGARFLYVPGWTGFYRWHPGERVSRSHAAEIARATFAILGEAERRLEEQERQLSEEYAEALCRYYWRLAANALPVGRAEFNEGLRNALRLKPGFEPDEAGQTLLYRLFGYSGAAWTLWLRSAPRRLAKRTAKGLLGARRFEKSVTRFRSTSQLFS